MDFDFRKTFGPLFKNYPMMWFIAGLAEIVLFIWIFISPFDDGFDTRRIQAMVFIPFVMLLLAMTHRYGEALPAVRFCLLANSVTLATDSALSMPTEMTSLFGPVPKYPLYGYSVASWPTLATQLGMVLLMLLVLHFFLKKRREGCWA
ncbi:hypothetical protein K2Q00_02700 [Patescibacteria group bacterium]|nr:hypothetical protein [Patescibacteria group bacterium]